MNRARALAIACDAMRAAGLNPPPPERWPLADKFCRFSTLPNRRGDDAGWCRLIEAGTGADVGYVAVWGDWRSGAQGSLPIFDEGTVPMQIRHAAVREAKQTHVRQERERHEQAAARAQEIWNGAVAADPQHGYLVRKMVGVHGLRMLPADQQPFTRLRGCGPVLLVPLRAEDGRLWSLEAIADPARVRPDEDGKIRNKQTLHEGRCSGCFHLIGAPAVGDEIIVAEGYATGASLYEAAGAAVAVARSCGNLETVARAIRRTFEPSRLVIAADNDPAGLAHAKAAALAVCGVAITPAEGFNDFNDEWRAWLRSQPPHKEQSAPDLGGSGAPASPVGLVNRRAANAALESTTQP